jgi:hypothetical protein
MISKIQNFISSLFLLLAFVLSSCGSHNSVTVNTPDQDDTPISLLEYTIPFTAKFPLIPPQQIGESILLPAPDYSNSTIGWWINQENQLKLAAVTRSGSTVPVDPCTFKKRGDYTLTAIAYAPFDTNLIFPLGATPTTFTIDPGCGGLQFEEIKLPETTNEGDSEQLFIRVRLEDENGNLILDPDGNRLRSPLLLPRAMSIPAMDAQISRETSSRVPSC